jgi:hypothetical protein
LMSEFFLGPSLWVANMDSATKARAAMNMNRIGT